MADLTKEEFTRRFVAYMTAHAGFEAFDDGMKVSDYAAEVAESYWLEQGILDTPEDCAHCDMDYWGED